MATLNQGLRALLDTHPLAVIALLLVVEELGVPSPIPGDLMMILAGVKVAQGIYPLWLVLVVQEAATLAGSCGLYALCRRAGRPLVARYGRYVHLGPEALARAEGQLRRRGGRAIVLGRLLPGLRIVTPIAAGTLGVPFARFFPALALGAFLYLLAYTLLGLVLGPAALTLVERVARAAGALVSLVAAALLVRLARQVRRALPAGARGGRRGVGTALVAGLVAGVVALLATNGLVGLVGPGARLVGRPAPDVAPILTGAAEGSTGLHLLLGGPGFLLAAGALAVLAGRPTGARGRHVAVALAAALPLALTLLLVVSLVTRPPGGLARESVAIVLAVETLRWAVFGLALGPVLPRAAEQQAADPAP